MANVSAAPNDSKAQDKKQNKSQQGKTAIFKKLGPAFWIALIILFILLLLSIILLSIRLYTFTKIDDRELALHANFEADLELFSITYKNSSGEVTIEGADGQKVIAPGSHTDYTIRLRNKDKVALDYHLIPKVEFTSEYEIPVLFRLIDPDDYYLMGSASEFVKLETLNGVTDTGTLKRGETAEYIFQWQWPFESGDDAYDTWLGNNAITEDITITVTFTVLAEANKASDLNDGLFGDDTGRIFFLLIFIILLITAIILFIISILKRIHLGEPTPPPAPVEAPEPIPEPEPIVVPPAIEPAAADLDLPPLPLILGTPPAIPAPAPVVVPEPVIIPEPELVTDAGKQAFVNLDTLVASFEDGAVIDMDALKAKKLISPKAKELKILARLDGDLTKAFTIKATAFSADARRMIIAAGGKAEKIKVQKNSKKSK